MADNDREPPAEPPADEVPAPDDDEAADLAPAAFGAPDGDPGLSEAGAGPPLSGSQRTLPKVFEYTVSVENPIHFCSDKPRHLLTALRNHLEGRNFKGAHIVRIVRVLEASAVHIQRTNGSGGGYVDTRVLAEALVFARWDILVGATVLANQQMVVGAYTPPGDSGAPRAAVALQASKAAETLTVGQLFAARVVHATHPPMQMQAAVYGTLLVCDQAAPVWRVRGNLDRSARAELAPLLAGIEAELAARDALLASRKADVWFFEHLLHPYRAGERERERARGAGEQTVPAWPGGPAWVGPPDPVPHEPGAQLVSPVEIARRVVREGASVPVSGVWSRPLSLYRSSPLAAVAPVPKPGQPEGPPPGWAPAADSVPRAVFAELLRNILDHLRAIRELPEVYSTPALVAQHANLWGAMRAAQRPLP